MSKCTDSGSSTNSILDTFLVPNPTDDCLVILTDKDMNGGVITNCFTPTSLTRGALRVLCQSFIEGAKTLGDILEGKDPGTISNISLWANQLTRDNFFRVSVNEPEIVKSKPRSIKAGEKIPANCPNDAIAVFDGIIITVHVNNTKIIWYVADTDLGVTSINDVGSTAAYGTFGATLYPTTSTDLGSGNSCVACVGCAACTPCIACATCFGINYGAAVLVTSLALTGLATMGSTAAIETLRNNNTR